MIKENQKYLNRLAVVLDGSSIIIALLVAWAFRFKSGVIPLNGIYLPLIQYLKASIIIIPIYLSIYNILRLYSPRRIKTVFEEFYNIIKANILGLLIFIFLLYLIKQMNYSRYFLLVFGILNIIITTLARTIIRIILRNIRRSGKNLRHIVLVGFSDLTLEFLNKISLNKHWGYNVLAILYDSVQVSEYSNAEELLKQTSFSSLLTEVKEQAAASLQDAKCDSIAYNPFKSINIIKDTSNLTKILNNTKIDEVFITLSLKEYDKLGKIIEVCEKSGVRTQIIPDYYKYIPAKPYIEEIDGLPIINIRYVPLENLINKVMKRFFDIVLSILCIIIFSPIMLFTALVIKVTSPGPIIFKQSRIGLNRRSFIMYKFRSMHVQDPNNERKEWTSKEDTRKTKFGSFIRKVSIDELPQFFNVLKGDMSIIGPRPERSFFVEKFKDEIPKYMIKHQVRPGITGWAQVNGWRGDTSIKKRIEYDIYYIENWSLSLDIKIMWFTIFKGFVNKNAY